jgi:hypothetical protein
VAREKNWFRALIGALFVAMISSFLWTASATSNWPKEPIPNNFSRPALALQFVQSEKDVDTLLTTARPDRIADLDNSLWRDFLFIAFYSGFLVSMGRLFERSHGSGLAWLALLVPLAAITAGGADCVENVFSMNLLDRRAGDMAPLLTPLYWAVHVKWTLLFAVTAVLGFLPFARHGLFALPWAPTWVNRVTRWIIAIVCWLAAGLGLAGLTSPPSLETTSVLMFGAWFLLWGIAMLGNWKEDAGKQPATLSEVLLAEFAQIGLRRAAHNLGASPTDREIADAEKVGLYQWAGKQHTVGLAFSGGGIRSATFNLGVLQALAKLGLLKYIDFLSTVSGGGYIGGWFAAWIQRRRSLAEVERLLQPDRIAQTPQGMPPPKTAAVEPPPIFHLRRFSNYLSPKLGLLSADVWVMFAIYLRNLIICQLVLLPGVVAILLLSRLQMLLYHSETPAFVFSFLKIRDEDITSFEWTLAGIVLSLWFVAAFIAFLGSGWVRPEDAAGDGRMDKNRLTPADLAWVVRFLLLAAILFCWFPAIHVHKSQAVFNVEPAAEKRQEPGQQDQGKAKAGKVDWDSLYSYLTGSAPSLGVFLAFLGFPMAAVLLAYGASLYFHREWREVPRRVFCAIVSSAVSGVLLFLVWILLIWLISPGPGDLTDYVHARAAARVTTFGPPLVLGVIVLGICLAIAFLKNSVGEELREWWSSLCARLMIYASVWMSINLIAIYATALVIWSGPWMQTALASGWVVTVLGGVFASQSPGTGAQKPTNSTLDWLARLAPMVFVIGLLIAISLATHALLDTPPNWERGLDTLDWMRYDDPAHVAVKLTRTTTDDGKKNKKTENKEVVEKSRVFNQERVASGIYWLSMFNTDKTIVPRQKFQLQPDDIQYLLDHRKLDPAIAKELYEISLAGPDDTPEEFIAKYCGIVNTRDEARPGDVTLEELREIAVDAVMIKYDPGLLLLKFSAALFVCVVLLLVAAYVVDVNRFSLSALYGNRLMRCYLGASNPHRSPDPISGFDPDDDLKLTDLKIKKGTYDGPYLLMNTALNLVGGDELAWQERKAESFVLSPLNCGSDSTGFSNTEIYAGGLNLSTAMTISGAAASPNSGYHSSPAVTALLTVFNARLGAWLGNPMRRQRDASPTLGILYLLKELFGQTRSDSAYVYLSDGGHFENLGVYELVRRRCRYIIMSDADADEPHVFEELGKLIGKCRSDFGIAIDIDLEALRLAHNSKRTRWHCAVGKIRYDHVDFGAIPGTLIYIKPSLTGDESADILHYASQNSSFPHESTLDQFFSESQFESYRALGQHITERIFTDACDDMNTEIEEDTAGERRKTDACDDMNTEIEEDTAGERRKNACRALFSSVARPCFAMPPEYESSFLHTTEAYMDFQKSLASDVKLNALAKDLYRELVPEGDASKTDDAGKTEGAVQNPVFAEFHTLLNMLKILENAWLNLNLDVHYAHPLNRGWLDVFYRWTRGELFRKHWPVMRSEFSRRFVDFCELQMRVGRIHVWTTPLDGQSVPPILEREFKVEWPTLPGLASLVPKTDLGACWLIHSEMSPSADNATSNAPLGIIIVRPDPQEPEKALELTIWIRGAYRNTGIGRAALRLVRKEILAKKAGQTCLRVYLPKAAFSGPGGMALKVMWLTFFSYFDFGEVQPTKGKITLERPF